jgi:hypothetical protein
VPAARRATGEDRTGTIVFALCANCDLRAEPTQCELSDQEQATPRALPPVPDYGCMPQTLVGRLRGRERI